MAKQDPRADTDSHVPIGASAVVLADKLNGNISRGSGEHNVLTGNLIGITYDLLTPNPANTDFTVFHNLLYIPQRCVIVRADRAASIYDSPVKARDEYTITLRCNVADATLKLEIY